MAVPAGRQDYDIFKPITTGPLCSVQGGSCCLFLCSFFCSFFCLSAVSTAFSPGWKGECLPAFDEGYRPGGQGRFSPLDIPDSYCEAEGDGDGGSEEERPRGRGRRKISISSKKNGARTKCRLRFLWENQMLI